METLLNEADLAFVADVRRRDAALHLWRGNRCSYRTDEVPHYINAPTNEERGAAEVIDFLARPLAKGECYRAYLSSDGRSITTWMGDVLVPSIRATGLGSRGWRGKGIDGRIYHGRQNGRCMHCTLRLSADQRAANAE